MLKSRKNEAERPVQCICEYGIKLAVSIPAAKNAANPAMSLSSVISLRIFANVAIIFVTLQGLANNGINSLNYDNLSSELRKLFPQVSASGYEKRGGL